MVNLSPWSDEPINQRAEDSLDRADFASIVSRRVLGLGSADGSTVVGVVGPWGSGKTSVLNMVRERLDDSWRVADFSPWSAPDPQSLALEFLASITVAVGSKRGRNRKVRAAVKKYARLATPFLGLIPVLGGFANGAADRGLELLDQSASWRKEFDALAKIMRNLDYSVLLVADDVDRLDAQELMAFLKVVRLLGRLPNVHYLIAYDQSTIEQLLASQGIEGRHNSFMEKIVQYPYELPTLSRALIRQRLSDAIERIVPPAGAETDQATAERASELISHLTPAMRTPRSITRYSEQLLAYAAAVSFDEIDPIDFAALTYLRIAQHDLFDRLGDWEEELRSGHRPSVLDEGDRGLDDQDWRTRLEQVVAPHEVEVAHRVLSLMFPGVPLLGVARWIDHPRAMSDERYFERYLLLRVSESDVSDHLLNRVLREFEANTVDGEAVAELTRVLDGPDDARAAAALEKLLAVRGPIDLASRPLTMYLAGRLTRPLREVGFASSGTVLRRLAELEFSRSLLQGRVTADEILDTIGLDSTLRFLLMMNRDFSLPKESRKDILAMFSVPLRAILHGDVAGALVNGRFAILVSFFVQAEGEESVSGVAATLILDHPERLIEVARAFVVVERWVGVDGESPELSFNEKAYRLVTSLESRTKGAPYLPSVPPLSKIDEEDVSPENQHLFAAAWARQIADVDAEQLGPDRNSM